MLCYFLLPWIVLLYTQRVWDHGNGVAGVWEGWGKVRNSLGRGRSTRKKTRSQCLGEHRIVWASRGQITRYGINIQTKQLLKFFMQKLVGAANEGDQQKHRKQRHRQNGTLGLSFIRIMAKDPIFKGLSNIFTCIVPHSLSWLLGNSVLLISSMFIGFCGPVIKGSWKLHVHIWCQQWQKTNARGVSFSHRPDLKNVLNSMDFILSSINDLSDSLESPHNHTIG